MGHLAGSNPAPNQRDATAARIEKKLIFTRCEKMKNPILKICEKLRGYSDTEPYFEVTEIKANENGTFTVTCKVVVPATDEGAENDSN